MEREFSFRPHLGTNFEHNFYEIPEHLTISQETSMIWGVLLYFIPFI